MLKVTHIQRRSRAMGNFSIESYFQMIRDLAPQDILFNLYICPFFSIGLWRRVFNLFLVALIRSGDVLHVTGDVQYLPILMPRKKTILTIHDCGNLKDKSGISFNLIKWLWLQWPARSAAYITVNSNATKKDILSYISYPPHKIKVIYICIKDHFTYCPKEFNEICPVILQIGTAPNKNIDRLIASLKGISCQLIVLGKLSYDQKQLLIANRINHESIDHAVSDEKLLELYQQADIISFVSTLEGFGMPIVEANAVGRVVVTSSISAMPEIAGDAAVLVDPYDVEALHQAFQKVITQPGYRKILIQNGIINAKRFDKFFIAQQYFDVYREIHTINQN